MKINLSDKPSVRWETVTCPAGEFEVAVQNPTYEQQGRDTNTGDRPWLLYRIETSIVDWRGVNDENDDPIPFHFRNVKAFCHQFPTVFNQLLALANIAFAGLPDGDAGNSESPSNES